VTDLTSK